MMTQFMRREVGKVLAQGLEPLQKVQLALEFWITEEVRKAPAILRKTELFKRRDREGSSV